MPGWTAAFKAIPWMEVIAAAPVVARGARKLWADIRPVQGGGAGREERMTALEDQVAGLGKDLGEAAKVIQSLVEQQGRLLEAVAILRARVRALFVAVAALAVGWIGLAVWIAR